MSDFMQPELEFGAWYIVDGSCGADIIPADLINAAEVDALLAADDTGAAFSLLADYCENSAAWSIEKRDAWGARFSAPGYMDCTAWELFDSKIEALLSLDLGADGAAEVDSDTLDLDNDCTPTLPTRDLRKLYRGFRAAGFSARDAYHGAATWLQFDAIAAEGFARIVLTHEHENYFDVFGEPEAYTGANGRRVSADEARAEIVRAIELNGNYCVAAEVRHGAGSWENVDCVGMCAGYQNAADPRQNCYVVDLMSAAIEAYQNR